MGTTTCASPTKNSSTRRLGLLLSPLSVLGAALLFGCYIGERESWDDYYSGVENSLEVREAEFEGSLGTVGDFAVEADEIHVHTAYRRSDGGLYIEVHGEGRRWWAMNGLSVYGDIEPGTHIDTAQSLGDGNGAYILGCTGPERFDFDYDISADRVIVDITEGPQQGTLEVRWEAQFPAASGAPSGTVYGSAVVVE